MVGLELVELLRVQNLDHRAFPLLIGLFQLLPNAIPVIGGGGGPVAVAFFQPARHLPAQLRHFLSGTGLSPAVIGRGLLDGFKLFALKAQLRDHGLILPPWRLVTIAPHQ